MAFFYFSILFFHLFFKGICQFSDYPQLFLNYFNYLNAIDAQDQPDYDRLVELFTQQLTAQDLENTDFGIFDADIGMDSDENDTINENLNSSSISSQQPNFDRFHSAFFGDE